MRSSERFDPTAPVFDAWRATMKHLAIGIAMMIGAAVFGIQQIAARNRSNELRRSGERGEATILRLETRTEPRKPVRFGKGGNRSIYVLHCGLTLADGATRFGEATASYEFYAAVREGSKHPIRYDAGNPDDFLFEQDEKKNEEPAGGMLGALALFICGGAFTGWGIVHNAATRGRGREPEILRELP
jgi:hypothetical protein